MPGSDLRCCRHNENSHSAIARRPRIGAYLFRKSVTFLAQCRLNASQETSANDDHA